MDTENYEQHPLSEKMVGESVGLLKENSKVKVTYYENKVMGVELPTFVELKVVETEPGYKGNTVSGGNKPATLETGAVVQVPMFVKVGDKLKVDTRTGEYVQRV